MKEKEEEINNLLSDSIKKLKESDSDASKEAIRAIEKTSQVMEAIMAGRQIDASFYNIIASKTIKRIKKKK